MNVRKIAFYFYILSLTSFVSFSQEKENPSIDLLEKDVMQIDSTGQKERNLFIREKNPALAGLYSAILPGLGQYYNRASWWKYPIYIALIGVGIYFIKTEHEDYKRYRNEYITLLNGGQDELILRRFINLANDAEQNRGYAIIFTTILYLANIIDAIVDAHLSRFKVDKDLRVSTSFLNHPNFGISPGITIAFHF